MMSTNELVQTGIQAGFAVFILLESFICSEAPKIPVGNQQTETMVSSRVDEVLQHFALTGSVPELGVTGMPINEPTSPVFNMLRLAIDDDIFAAAIGLSPDQREKAIEILDFEFKGELSLAIEDESRTDPELYNFLDESQRRKLELTALRMEGCVVIKRTFFATELKLDEHTRKQIDEILAKIRRERVLPRIRKYFASPVADRYFWESTVDSIEVNLSILKLLTGEQKLALSKLVEAAKSHDELYELFLEELFQNSPAKQE